jgi:outer membrane protein TolC
VVAGDWSFGRFGLTRGCAAALELIMVQRRHPTSAYALLAIALSASLVGCRSGGTESASADPFTEASSKPVVHLPPVTAGSLPEVESISTPRPNSTPTEGVILAAAQCPVSEPTDLGTLADLVSQAVASNPQIRRLEAETRAARERIPQSRALPDPMAEGTYFGVPQLMADGEMRGTFMVSQSIPYFKQLGAQEQEAIFEALVMQQETQSARLKVTADVEESWYRLYLLGQLLQINEANRQLIESLVEVATGRVEVGETTPGDVVLGTLEMSRVEEERLMLEQQLATRKAMLNQLLNRPADAALPIPETLVEVPIGPTLEELRAVAYGSQPEIVAARLRTEAAAWGIRVARFERVPEVTLLYEHMFMKMNPGDHGSDPWRVGMGMNVPLWRAKYTAMEREAQQRTFAARQGIEETMREFDAMLVDWLEQARAAERTAGLYRETILPQSRQALESDQRAYSQGTVTFERVIGDAQNLLTAESALHRAMTEEAIAIARLKQAVGGTLPPSSEELTPPRPISFSPD